MANLAEQLKAELTERARNSESCKKYLLDWVMNEFRNGENPVYIKCSDTAHFNGVSKELLEKFEFTYKGTSEYFKFSYEDGKHFAKFRGKTLDITNLSDAQSFAADGRDESDKTLFLKSEGFNVFKTWICGRGDLLEITY